MLESSEQSIVTPLLGLKSQDLHQVCIVPQDFTRSHHSEHYSLKLNSSKLFSLRSFPLRVMRVTGWSWRVSVAQIMFWQLTILTTSFVVRRNFVFTAQSKIISESINIIHFTLILQHRKKLLQYIIQPTISAMFWFWELRASRLHYTEVCSALSSLPV